MKWLLLIFACAPLLAGEPTNSSSNEIAEKPLLSILYTAEAHAGFLPCDCPLQPLGGLARRATLIKQYRQRGPVLLLDGGGWGAGGMYDEESDGDIKRDEFRTELMAKAMKLMKYDFITVGPQESGLIANASLVPARLALPRPGEIKIQGFPLPIQMTGWSEPGTPLLATLSPEPPSTWERLASKDKHSLEIHLSRLGENGSEALARVVAPDLILSAGRKNSQRISWMIDKTPIVNFDFQAQRLIVIEVYSGKKTERLDAFKFVVRQEVLDKNMADDPEMTALLLPHLESLKKKSKKHIEAEFWTMPECPGCLTARPELQRIASELVGCVNLTLHFVVNKDENGEWVSPHGKRELLEARVQSIVQKYYPEKIWEWLEWREKNSTPTYAPWEEGAQKLGILSARIRGALATNESEKIFAADYELQSRRKIDGTPTLVIGNKIFEATLERLQILRVFCKLLDAPSPAACKDVPVCFFDSQCRKRGFIGKCVDAGKATARCDTSRAAIPVPTLVITDSENLFDNHERILEALISDLPGLEYRVLDYRNEEARILLMQSKISRIPAYFFDKIAQTEIDYEETLGKVTYIDTGNGSEQGSGKIIVRSKAVAAHRIVGRERIKGRVDLFVARLSKNGSEALETAITHVRTLGKSAPELVIHDAIFWSTPLPNTDAIKNPKPSDNEEQLAAPGGLPELEEAARGLSVKTIAPEKYLDYLLEAAKKRGSSWWDCPLKNIGVSVEKVRERSEGPAPAILALLQAEATLLKTLDAHGEIIVLVENVEIIPIRSRHDLRELLDKVAHRK